ncbi:MAG TPA: potassium transporter Kup [Gemmatimonadaceae bacterium]
MTADPARSGAPATAPTPPASAITHPTPPERHPVEPNPTGKRLALLSLTALGVVYGDIGTSPLYAFKEAFSPEYGVTTSAADIYGVLSLLCWTLTLIVSIKYIVFIMRADNRGEGGILALLALIQQRLRRGADRHRYKILVALGLIGAALLYGDGVITPAITVLSAVEGLHVINPVFGAVVVPLAVIILFVLFLFQQRGTTRIGVVFGPIMAIWFLSLGAFGLREIMKAPRILFAINPWYAIEFFANHGATGFFILGAVVLVVTGAEALYADMGHFGRRPIRVAWFTLVFPALLLNYFGQGALVLRDPSAAANPFYMLFPAKLLYPMLILATVAAVIASQALISGAFSLTQQAMQLGYSPRMTVLHTSREEAGQIYVPEVNKALMVGCILLVLFFRSSDNLAAAYGIAVTGTMVITTILFHYIARQQMRWRKRSAILFLVFFLIIDLSFLFANAIKIESGGWVPIAIALAIYTLMITWKSGRQILRNMLVETSLPIHLFLEDVKRRKPPRVPGTAVFMTSDVSGAPVVLLHHLKHNKVLHEQVLLLSILTADVPEIPSTERTSIEALGEGFYRVIARYGFMQTPNVKEVMRSCERAGVKLRPGDTTYYLGRERLLPTGKSRMARWRKSLFVFMSRNARSATEFFSIPPNRVVELGAQIEF